MNDFNLGANRVLCPWNVMIKKALLFFTITLVYACASSTSFAQSQEFFKVADLRKGMQGVGKTVFQGSKIEEFKVEILGVLKNSAPKQDMVLARISGGPLQQTGVLQGMSGSPVYIDGMLLGAVAFAFPFSKDPIAGIQPITQMLKVLDRKTFDRVGQGFYFKEGPQAYINKLMASASSGEGLTKQLIPQNGLYSNAVVPSLGNSGLAQIKTPLFISGASPLALLEFSDLFKNFGFTPIQGGGKGSVNYLGETDLTIEAGASINVELVRGDISVSANGTVTYVDEDKVFAFGHPFMSTGPTDMPMSKAYVIAQIPSLSTSFKIAVPLEVVGALKEDRATGIYGTLGSSPRMIPVSVKLQTSSGAIERYNFELVNDRFLTPFMMNFTIFNAIVASERNIGESTLKIIQTIHIEGRESIAISNAFAGDLDGPAKATVATVAPITYLLSGGFKEIVINGIELDIVSTDEKRNARLEAVTLDRAEVRAGETVAISARLRSANGAELVENYSFKIPSGLAPGKVQLLVGDGVSITSTELTRVQQSVPRDVDKVLRELRRLRKADRLYIKVISAAPGYVISGEELPSLPPSMIAVLQTGRSSDSNTSGPVHSTVGEFELPQSDYVIQGQRSLNLMIVQ